MSFASETPSPPPDPLRPLAARAEVPIPEVIEAWARATPQGIAIRQEGRCWTYHQLQQSVRDLTVAFAGRGIGPGAVVAVAGARGFGLIASLLAVLRCGGVMLALDPQLPTARLRAMLAEAGARWLIVVGPEGEALQVGEPAVTTIRVEADGRRATGATNRAEAEADWRPPRLGPDQDAYIFFTSGTTGAPKGVLGLHGGLSHFLRWQRETFAVAPGDRVAQLTSLSFDVMLRDIFLALTAGAALQLPPAGLGDTPAALLAWLARERITLLHAVPTLAQHWLSGAPAPLRLPHLRLVFFAGEPLTGALVTRWRETLGAAATLVNLYGPTETTLAKLYHLVEADPDPGVLPVGRPLPDTQALILAEDDTLCPPGRTGEILLRTPFRTRGYINAPQEQARRFTRNPLTADPDDIVYRTGDLGRYRTDGVIEILGRRDQQIKLRGVRIEPGEIEAALARHPAVRQAAVVLQESAATEPRLVAFLACADQPPPAAAALRRFLAETLPLAMIPTAFVPLTALPVTGSGKVDRRVLAASTPADPVAPAAAAAPGDALEAALLDLWRTLFDRADLGMGDDFFELGGGSLLALRLFAAIETTFGRKLPLATLFEAPRPVDLAAVIRARNSLSPWSSLVAIRAQGALPPLFHVHAAGGNLLVYRDLAFALGPDQPVYGLQPRGLDGVADPLRTVEEMAAHYLAQITRVQPQGPYYLCGLSSGGIIALEMAQRLRARGEQVALLAMFDTTGPDGYQPLPLPRRVASVLAWCARDRFQQFRRRLRARQGPARGMASPPDADTGRQRAKAREVLDRRLALYQARRRGLATVIDDALVRLLARSSRPFFAGILAEGMAYPADEGVEGGAAGVAQGGAQLGERLRWIQELSDQASRTYAPAPYGGRITYFQAMRSPPGVRPAPLAGWGRIAAGGIDIHPIPADHTTILHAPLLARRLAACLEGLRAAQPPAKGPSPS